MGETVDAGTKLSRKETDRGMDRGDDMASEGSCGHNTATQHSNRFDSHHGCSSFFSVGRGRARVTR